MIQPTPYDAKGQLIKRKTIYGWPGPSLIAALTPKEWEVQMVWRHRRSLDTDAEIIGISSMGHAVIRTLDIAKEFKKEERQLYWAVIWSA